MLIGILQLELRIGDALNLGEKRKYLRSLKDRWHHHHNVSVAEVDYLEHPQHALIGVVLAGSDAKQMESTLSKLVDSVRKDRYVELQDYRIEIVSGRD
ncbi:MAG: DUF503 domain-containing protein [Phycisphaerales bacterium]|nr:DUF503 domain-containing protein [Phycisphaerales bacterium]